MFFVFRFQMCTLVSYTFSSRLSLFFQLLTADHATGQVRTGQVRTGHLRAMMLMKLAAELAQARKSKVAGGSLHTSHN